MPYIKADRRAVIGNWLKVAWAKAEGEPDPATMRADAGPQDCGELNYALTMTCIGHDQMKFGGLDARLKFIGTFYLTSKPIRYQRINDLIGACECAAMEIERRRPSAKKFEIITLRHLARSAYATFAVGYEIQKIAENGDIDFGERAAVEAIRAKQETKL